MRPRELPKLCPVCGSDRIARIVWGYKFLLGDIADDIRAGRVVLGLPSALKEQPSWTCLVCNEGWLQVHSLAIQEEEYWQKIEEAVANQDFATAVQLRDRKNELRDKRLQLLAVLQNEEYEGTGSQ